MLRNGGHEDRKTHRHHNDDGEYKEHGHIIGKRSHNGARIAYLPYLVKRFLNIVYQHQYRVEHKQQAHTQEDTTLRVDEVTVDKVGQDIGHLRLRR